MSRLSPQDQLAALATMSPAHLSAEWQLLYDAPCPRLTPALLRLGIAYRLQEKASGRRSKAPSPTSRRAARARAVAVMAPGTQLVRSWNGRTVSVTAEERGFSFNGQTYPSLSAIAKAVTGAHWSGPRFFGLTRRG